MSITNGFIEDLIQMRAPANGIWKHLLSIWNPSRYSKIDDYYEKCEEATRRLENVLDVAYPEFYEKELPQRCVPERQVADLQRPILWMDGLSIREARLLERDLNATLMGPFFSALPSETLEYRRRVGINIYKVIDFEDPRILSYIDEVGCSLPDSHFTDICGRDPPMFSLMYSKTKSAIENIFKALKTERLLVISDHGYIDVLRASRMGKEVEAQMKDIFKNHRFTNSHHAERLVKMGHAVKYGGNYLLKGRRSWTKKGKYQRFIHGGLSLMECMIPCLEILKM